ncbi:MAG: ftsQ, partial [Frankiales bacterium]|nr:ftsQ [Frankiales bacterium]
GRTGTRPRGPPVSPTQTRGPGPRTRVLPAVPRLQARAREERRAARVRRLRRWGGAVAAVLGALGLGWLLLASALFDVDRVKVVGASGAAADQVVRTADVTPGAALITVDLDAARERVTALPAVASARVSRSWPGSVVITVTPRVPVALTTEPDGSRGLVAGDGILVSRLPAGTVPPPGLPSLVVPPGDPLVGAATVRAALAALAELPPALRSATTQVTGASPDSVVFTIGGRQVVWGPPGDAAVKGAAVVALLARPGGQIDVTTPQVAVVQDAPQ